LEEWSYSSTLTSALKVTNVKQTPIHGEARNVCKILTGKPHGKRLIWRPRHRLDGTIKMTLMITGYEDVYWLKPGLNGRL
jgi:hypothetical protein